MRWRLSNQKDGGPVSGSENETERRVAPGWPGRACCCPAAPMVRVVMPETADRPCSVDLYLCGHHYRASRDALAAAHASVYDSHGRIDQFPVCADLMAA